MDTGSFSPLSPLFQKAAAKHKVTRQLDEAHACFVMNQLLKDLAPQKAKTIPPQATELKNSVMTIRVTTSAQSQNVALHKLDLLNQMHEKGFSITSFRIQLA